MKDLRKIILTLTFISFISSMINISWATDFDGAWVGHELTNEGISGEIYMTFLDSNVTFTSELYEEYVSGYYIDHPEVGTYNIEIFIEEYIIGDTTHSQFIGLSSLCIYEILFAPESLEDWDDTLTIACNVPGSEEWPFTLNPEDSGSTVRIFWLIRSNCDPPCEILGCTYEEATNYNPEATDDDGSCEFMWGDVNHDGELNIQDLISIVNQILSF